MQPDVLLDTVLLLLPTVAWFAKAVDGCGLLLLLLLVRSKPFTLPALKLPDPLLDSKDPVLRD
jgi:hypothetical protein